MSEGVTDGMSETTGRPESMGPMDRRGFFRSAFARSAAVTGAALALTGPVPALLAQAADAGRAGSPSAGAGPGASDTTAVSSLGDPSAAGNSATPTSRYDDDPRIKTIEQHLACRCGCTLDVFTCRTTDFTCTYSPAMHREVVALYQDGRTGQQIADAFVAKYGEKVLMAPEARGFNLAGYLVPGAAITVMGGLLAWLIVRRHTLSAAGAGAAHGAELGVAGSIGPSADSARTPAAPAASPEELERLRQALQEIED